MSTLRTLIKGVVLASLYLAALASPILAEINFAAIFQDTGESSAWAANHNIPAADYQSHFDQRVDEGYRLQRVSGYESNGQLYYSSLWVKESGPAWQAAPWSHELRISSRLQ